MATLRYSQVRAHPGGTIHYIANKDKIISDKVHDVYNVLNYMGEPESTERVYTFARHCSCNPDLAEKQIALHRARYYESKTGGVQGLKEGREELLGLHFFQSYTEDDDPSEEAMNDIAMKIAEHPKFKDFAFFSSNHFDKKHKHTHFFVSQFSADGKPRKLCMRHDDFNDIRRYANRLCVEHGLSIIDLAVLRNDPEYSAWLDGVIAEGKVVVHPEKEEHKRQPKQKTPTKNVYYKWMKEQEEDADIEYRLLTDRQRQKKNFESTYYFTPDGDEKKRWYVSGDPQRRFYVVPLVSKEGYRRSTFELTVRFVVAVATGESKYVKRENPEMWLATHAKVDAELQNMVDALQTAREMQITNTGDVAVRIADVGKQMNALKREKARHEGSIKTHEKIIEAHNAYERVRPLVEGVKEPEPEAVSEYKTAYAILAQNQILTEQAFAELRARYEFEKRKTVDYDKRMKEYNRQYRELKKLEAVAGNPVGMIRNAYARSERATVHSHDGSIDSIIGNAKTRVSGNNGVSGRREHEREY